MIIKYLSDLHLEFIKPHKMANFLRKITPSKEEICVLAGDIGNPYQENYNILMEYMNKNFKKTFIITGNHEYYNNYIEETNEYLENYFQKYKNISFLNNKIEIYNDYCFIGSTLQSNITDPQYEINDVYFIKNFNYIKYNKLNENSVNFITNALKENTDKKSILITHHVPSYSLIDKKYKKLDMDKYNQWFYCNMDEIINNNKDNIKCWIYGHTHSTSNRLIDNIPFICNPIGYPGENSNINCNQSIILS